MIRPASIHYVLFAALVALSTLPAFGQNNAARIATAANVPALRFASVDVADFDGDGDFDLVVTGENALAKPDTRVLRFEQRLLVEFPNSAPQIVAQHSVFSAVLRNVQRGAARWGDYDGDGDPDLVITGLTMEDADVGTVVERPITEIFINDDGGAFQPDNQLQLPGLFDSDAAWGDYDQDGDLDLVVAGTTGSERLTVIYRNDGQGRLVDVQAALPGVTLPNLTWSDYDGDSDLDLLLAGMRDGSRPLVRLYRNDGNDRFVDAGIELPQYVMASAAWGDYDDDGDPDLILSGGTLGPSLLHGTTQLFRNDGGALTPVETTLQGVFGGTVAWGDYDGDGDLDAFVTGPDRVAKSDAEQFLVYRNDGGILSQDLALRGIMLGESIWYDYDGNGRLDVLSVGTQGDLRVVTLFEL